MKASSAVAVFGLQVSLAATSLQFCAAQNPLAALENEAKEKAAEVALTKVLNDNLPLTLDAKDVYPTVTTLPGGPFSPTPLKLTADQLDQPLPPGDYTINTLDFCSQYSIHEPGAGLAYVLGPYEGKAAGAIGALIWRGTEQYGINPNSLQAVSWTIQSGLTYDQMPKSYQAIVDQVIPDYKSEITGDFVTNLESTYNSLAKAASLPPLDTILAKLGAPGQLALDAERQRQILTAQNTNDQIKEQTLFQGQESGIYTPVKAETGPWTERVAGQVYMKLLIAGGNMATNNVMQIRVMPSPTANARVQSGGPHLVQASYGGAQATPAVDNAPITLTNLMEGMLGYAVGRGAQALGQVAVVLKALNPLAVTPAEADEPPAPAQPAPPAPPAPGTPSPTSPPTQAAFILAAKTLSPAPVLQKCLNSPADAGISSLPNIHFASCSAAMTSQQVYAAYNDLYLCSATFRKKMNGIKGQVFVTVVDGKSPLGVSFQAGAIAGYNNIVNINPNSGVQPPPKNAPEDYAYTYRQEKSGNIRVVLSAQNLIYNVYPIQFSTGPYYDFPADACGVTQDPISSPEPVEQLLAYELAENAAGWDADSNYTEHPDEGETNTIMFELGYGKNLMFQINLTKDETPARNCASMSGATNYDIHRASEYIGIDQTGGIFDFANQKSILSKPSDPYPHCAVYYDSRTSSAGQTRSCDYPEPKNACQAPGGATQ
jgi:hypothetical protein